MVNMNIRSIAKKLSKFDLYLKKLNHDFPIIALSETWLIDIIEYTVPDDLCFQNGVSETLFIEIDKDQFLKKQNIIIGVIYRPPDTDIK